jgi:hypothetical protein
VTIIQKILKNPETIFYAKCLYSNYNRAKFSTGIGSTGSEMCDILIKGTLKRKNESTKHMGGCLMPSI